MLRTAVSPPRVRALNASLPITSLLPSLYVTRYSSLSVIPVSAARDAQETPVSGT